jgi:hypothetical protein
MTYIFFALTITLILSTIVSYTANFIELNKIGFYAANIAIGSFFGIFALIIIDIFYIIAQGI